MRGTLLSDPNELLHAPQPSSSFSLIPSLLHSHVNLEWCDKIKLSNLLLPRKSGTIKRPQPYTLNPKSKLMTCTLDRNLVTCTETGQRANNAGASNSPLRSQHGVVSTALKPLSLTHALSLSLSLTHTHTHTHTTYKSSPSVTTCTLHHNLHNRTKGESCGCE